MKLIFDNPYKNLRLENGPVKQEIRQALLSAYLSNWVRGKEDTAEGEKTIENEVATRYNNAVDFVLPWVTKKPKLINKEIVEIGCGSGSSTAAFGHISRFVHAYEINLPTIKGARERLRILGIKNAEINHVAPNDILGTVQRKHCDGIDAVLLYAVLEHLTIKERLELIRTIWDLLKPGGYLIIVGTPNRFSYWDYHTSFMPFFHLLPEELALKYYKRSKRDTFINAISDSLNNSKNNSNAENLLYRWGMGVSFHEFQIALNLEMDQLADLIVCDGYEPEIEAWYPNNIEQKLLQTFLLERAPGIPIGFSRVVLNMVFQKNGDTIGVSDRRYRRDSGNENHYYAKYNPNIQNYEEIKRKYHNLLK